MKQVHWIILSAILCMAGSCTAKKGDLSNSKIGIQTYTFHNFTLMETLDKTRELGLHYAEAFFFQTLGGNFADTAYLNYDITEKVKKQLLEEFRKRDIKLYSFGVAYYDTTEQWDNFFRFAKEMGIHTVTCEPYLDHLDYVEQLALRYNIQVAIHNHPDPSIYADPAVVAEALEGRDPVMGVCADIGHWKRSGFDPLETLKLFEGRLKVVHLKDLSAGLDDTTWGTGILPVKQVIDELKRQNFDGLISIEYENFTDSQLDDIEKSLTWYYNQIQ